MCILLLFCCNVHVWENNENTIEVEEEKKYALRSDAGFNINIPSHTLLSYTWFI